MFEVPKELLSIGRRRDPVLYEEFGFPSSHLHLDELVQDRNLERRVQLASCFREFLSKGHDVTVLAAAVILAEVDG